MAEQIIRVGIWESAPFKGSLFRGIDRVNEFLKESSFDISYVGELLNVGNVLSMESKQLPDILFLDGGEDVNPGRYNEENRYSHFSHRRDEAEFQLADIFYNWGKRLSGVCRGHQVLNVYFGGSLYQDIHNDGVMPTRYLSDHSGGHKVHIKRPNPYPFSATHVSKIERNRYAKATKNKRHHVISRYTGNSPFTVSSMHHQSVKDLGRGLGISLVFGNTKNTPRYIVEGIESADGRIRGVQSHPEFNGYPKDGLLFSYLLHVDDFVDGIIEPDVDAVKKRLKIKKKEAVVPFDSLAMQHHERNGDRNRRNTLPDGLDYPNEPPSLRIRREVPNDDQSIPEEQAVAMREFPMDEFADSDFEELD
ncbi:MAG: gamma-glutamyl-gamma-aminobutyrate hydrolase family protein [Candidatus Kariarchaeaceae archaeon]|jgi:gamma-glutamyl-gamma-aminobutyrate hydrolase PuuD